MGVMTTTDDVQWAVALDGLTRNERGAVDARMTPRAYAARALVFDQGDEGTELLVVQSGRIRLFHRTPDGQEFTSGIWSSGYTIGLVSALLGHKRALCAESIDGVSVAVLARRHLLRLMEEIPRFAVNVARLIALLANDSFMRSAPLALDSADVRLGKVLIRLGVADDAGEERRVVVRGLSQEDLARMVGASRAWINRALASFESEGLITRRRGVIVIPDVTRFRRALDRGG